MTPLHISVIVALIAFLQSVLSTCPTNAVNDVFNCLGNLTIGLHDDNIKAGEDVDVIRRHCEFLAVGGNIRTMSKTTRLRRHLINLEGGGYVVALMNMGWSLGAFPSMLRSGEFESSATCVERLFMACRHTQQIHLLYKLVDPNKIRLSFDKICGKLDLYSESKRCIMKQDVIIKKCFHDIEYIFHFNIARAKYVNHVIVTYCGFQLGLRECIVGPVAKACGPDIGLLMNDFMDGVTAPICHNLEPTSSKDRLKSNHILCTLPLTIALLLIRNIIP